MAEMPDLCGCRIITYYLEDVERSADIIKSTFEVLEEELSHQPSALNDDQFGYLSAHYVVKLRRDRARLPEWASYAKFRVEIQIRTVIQHAWSAVSHAMQYKAETEVPSALRRRLFRIASLFELADEEFGAIRDQRMRLRSAASTALTAGNLKLPLTVTTIEGLAKSWKGMQTAVASAEKAGFKVASYKDTDTPGNIYDLLQKANIDSIEGLERLVSAQDNAIFFKLREGNADEWQISHTFILYLLLIASQHGLVTEDYLVERGWSRGIAKQVCQAIS